MTIGYTFDRTPWNNNWRCSVRYSIKIPLFNDFIECAGLQQLCSEFYFRILNPQAYLDDILNYRIAESFAVFGEDLC
jgi:hypothetical protein